jgi:hypothetical protein
LSRTSGRLLSVCRRCSSAARKQTTLAWPKSDFILGPGAGRRSFSYHTPELYLGRSGSALTGGQPSHAHDSAAIYYLRGPRRPCAGMPYCRYGWQESGKRALLGSGSGMHIEGAQQAVQIAGSCQLVVSRPTNRAAPDHCIWRTCLCVLAPFMQGSGSMPAL